MEASGEGAARTASFPGLEEDALFVALGKDAKESETVLNWALEKSQGKTICILHIHKPAERIPSGITMLPRRMVDEGRAKEYDDEEREKMHRLLDSYTLACGKAGVEATKVVEESSCVEKGIVDLIVQNEIKWLVMGAAANRSFSKRMKEPNSRKANYVRREAPSFCHIWLVCKGNLIYTRESKQSTITAESPLFQGSSSISCTSGSTSSTPRTRNSHAESQNAYHRVHSENSFMSRSKLGCEWGSPQRPFSQYPKLDWDKRSPQRNYSVLSKLPPQYSVGRTDADGAVSLPPATEEIEDGLTFLAVEATDDGLYDRLQQFATEAETSKKEAYEDSIKRMKAEKDAIEAIRRLKAAEALHSAKVRLLEETLSKSKEDAENTRLELDGVKNELRIAQELKSSLENQVAESDRMVEDLETKMRSAVDLLQQYKKERDELEMERDHALREAERLRKTSTSSCSSQLFLEFSYSEIREATNKFSPSCEIGGGGYGKVYLANLRHTKVAVKMLNPRSSQGPLQFRQEVDILSKLRHPNIISLIGACPEVCALVYEYIPGGDLHDRLDCKGNTPPLTWRTRIRIASELCSALIFLHSCPPHGVVHGDLKPSNVLLDANCVSKLCDFGLSHELSQDENDTTRCFWLDQAMGTRDYIAPEVLEHGELTTRSDVYSFGIIVLRLLSGKPAKGIAPEIQTAIQNGNLRDVLDPTAGDWPFVAAEQLARLAIRCTNRDKKHRPNLASEVWRLLEPMKVTYGACISEELPSYFVCPIFQEIMRDPVVAGDGFTYDSEAIKGWLESGHDTSPTTGLDLPHTELVPNHALRSAIQEWHQRCH